MKKFHTLMLMWNSVVILELILDTFEENMKVEYSIISWIYKVG